MNILQTYTTVSIIALAVVALLVFLAGKNRSDFPPSRADLLFDRARGCIDDLRRRLLRKRDRHGDDKRNVKD